MKKRFFLILIFLLLLRISISILLSDGTVKSDGIWYVGLTVNILENHKFTAMQDDTEEVLKGMTLDALFERYQGWKNPQERLLNFQWLHAFIYFPFILLWKSVYTVIILNNIFIFLAGIFLFKSVPQIENTFVKLIGWVLYLFFPPLIRLTNLFLTEPLFLFFLSFIIYNLIYKKRMNVFVFACCVGVCLTRPFGLVCVAAIILFLGIKNFRFASVCLLALIAAALINFSLRMEVKATDDLTLNPSFMKVIYSSNTIRGNGDYDYYTMSREIWGGDTVFVNYLNGNLTSIALAKDVIVQNVNNPKIFLRNSYNKTSAYFFNVLPDSWIYTGMKIQPVYKKILWFGQSILLIGLIFWGLKVSPLKENNFYIMLFIVSYIFHFITIAQYRYFLSILVLGMPYALVSINYLIEKLFNKAGGFGEIAKMLK